MATWASVWGTCSHILFGLAVFANESANRAKKVCGPFEEKSRTEHREEQKNNQAKIMEEDRELINRFRIRQ